MDETNTKPKTSFVPFPAVLFTLLERCNLYKSMSFLVYHRILIQGQGRLKSWILPRGCLQFSQFSAQLANHPNSRICHRHRHRHRHRRRHHHRHRHRRHGHRYI